MSVFRGVRSLPSEVDIINDAGRKIGTEIKPATLLGSRFEPQEVPADGVLVKSGALVLNGHALHALDGTPGDFVSAADAANWLNSEIKRINQNQGLEQKLGIEARVVNEVRVKVSGLKFDKDLEIDGSGPLINDSNRPSSAAELVALINDVFNPESGLYPPAGQRVAYLSDDGQELIVASPSGSTIQIGPDNDLLGNSGNALGISAGILHGRVELTPLREVAFDVSRIDLGKTLEIDGQAIDLSGVSTVRDLVPLLQSALNPAIGQPDIPVRRYVRLSSDERQLLITSPAGSPIQIGPQDAPDGSADNALGMDAGEYSGEVTRAEILLGLGAPGDPSVLSRLGYSTHVYIDGQIPEDLIVVATGKSTASFTVNQTTDAIDSLQSLRDRKFQIKFTSDAEYELIDITRVTDPADSLDLETNGTVVAKRLYNAVQGIHFQGMHFSLSRLPAKGDTYTIDGNRDGIGDNSNILKLAALETSRDLIPGALTIAESWHGQINEMGNLGNQARIAQEALKIVNEQAVEARDKVSGVSLDEEAADLVRFQQAYQASARIIQSANQLFDAILQVR